MPQVVNGVSALVEAEKNEVYEIGLKSSWLQNNLLVNVAAFQSEITNYQQAVRIYDEYTTNLNRVTNPNAEPATPVPRATCPGHRQGRGDRRGAERHPAHADPAGGCLERRALHGLPEFRAASGERQFSAPYRDVSDYVLPGAAKWTFDVGAEYYIPVLSNKEFHASINTAYSSRFNSDNALSSDARSMTTPSPTSRLACRVMTQLGPDAYVKNALNDDSGATRPGMRTRRAAEAVRTHAQRPLRIHHDFTFENGRSRRCKVSGVLRAAADTSADKPVADPWPRRRRRAGPINPSGVRRCRQ